MFSVNSKNLNIGCTARFGEIKGEKIVIATSGEKTIAHACSGKTPGSSARALQLVSTCYLRVQTFGTKSQLCKAFKAVRERQPLDNTFFLVIKPKHNLATVSTPLKPTWNTRKFSRGPPFCFCARGISSAGSRELICTRVMLSRALGSARVYQTSHSTITVVSHLNCVCKDVSP